MLNFNEKYILVNRKNNSGQNVLPSSSTEKIGEIRLRLWYLFL